MTVYKRFSYVSPGCSSCVYMRLLYRCISMGFCLVWNVNTYLLTYLLTYLQTWVLLEKLPIVQPLKNFPTFYGTQRFITVFTRALYWSLSWARSIKFIPLHSISLRFILILSTHVRLGLPSSLFPSGFPTNILKLIFLIGIVGVESNWVHSALRPPIGLLCQPRVIMMMEKLVEW
jgi:hypothetical protein